MNKTNRPVTSREYKLMLNTDRFKDRSADAETFWRLVKFLAERQGDAVCESQLETEKEKQRHTWYLDTPGLELRRNGVALRGRWNKKKGKGRRYKVTLKYRNADRYISASKDLSPPKKAKKDAYEHKFEEDVLPPFASKFSHSVSFESKKAPDISRISDAVELFPGLANLGIANDTPIARVNDFKAEERVIWLGKICFGGQGPSEADYIVKCCLSFWYLIGYEDELPLTAEFSFDYDVAEAAKDKNEVEQFPPEVVAGTNRFFHSLQKQRGWLNLDGTTKTAYAFDAL